MIEVLFINITIASANTWQRVSFKVVGDTTGTWNKDTSIGMRMRWGTFGTDYQTGTFDAWQAGQKMATSNSPINFNSATGDYIQITGVQVELGDTATTFEHRSYGEEESRCFRYFFSSIADKYWYNGHGGNVNDYTEISFPTKMRDTPTITFGTAITETNLNLSGGNGHAQRAVSSTGWQYGPRSAATGNSYGRINYTANAEL